MNYESFPQPIRVSLLKTQIKKSVIDKIGSVTILFQDSIPLKAYWECPVGANGLCCHVLVLFLFLKHYAETKENFLALSRTEQLQK